MGLHPGTLVSRGLGNDGDENCQIEKNEGTATQRKTDNRKGAPSVYNVPHKPTSIRLRATAR